MKVALDVQYDEAADRACAAAVAFLRWEDEAAHRELSRAHHGLAPYVPGSLYLRELPCVLPLVAALAEEAPVDTVVVDGYVDVAPGRPGLGRHLFEALGGGVVVVGVAKNPFAGAAHVEVLRGTSARPLYVTSSGDPEAAAALVARMAGEHRIPTLLGRVDAMARGR